MRRLRVHVTHRRDNWRTSVLVLLQQKTRGSGKHARHSKLYALKAGPIAPVVISVAVVLLTTTVLFVIQSYLATEHLLLFYLLPTIFIAIYFGSTVAVLASLASGLAAAYFLLLPQFSFYVADRQNIAELGFTMLLAVVASKAVGVIHKDARVARDEVIE
jgi:K+-sensing histidine kinase KdpD